MIKNITYIGKYENVNRGIWCGFKPDTAIIFDKKQILGADKGKILKNKETNITDYSVILENGDTEENYEEIDERDYLNDITN